MATNRVIPNLIGINGRINHGKDLSAMIILYLTSKYKNEVSFTEFKSLYESGMALEEKLEYKIVKWADKLKDIVCLLLNCTIKDLENRDFKNKVLPEEWWTVKCWYPADPNNKGKTSPQVFTLISVKEFDSRIFDGNDACMWETIKMTPRLLMQLLGTEAGRNIIHPNLWVNTTMSTFMKGKSKWIISDTRFLNEAEVLKEKGGIVVRVERDLARPENEHISETSLDSYNFDKHINNIGDIEDLVLMWDNYLFGAILGKEYKVTDKEGETFTSLAYTDNRDWDPFIFINTEGNIVREEDILTYKLIKND